MLDGWMDGWMNGWIDGRTDEWMEGVPYGSCGTKLTGKGDGGDRRSLALVVTLDQSPLVSRPWSVIPDQAPLVSHP